MPDRMGDMASFFTAKAGGLADVSAALITALFEQGAEVHVAAMKRMGLLRKLLKVYLDSVSNKSFAI